MPSDDQRGARASGHKAEKPRTLRSGSALPSQNPFVETAFSLGRTTANPWNWANCSADPRDASGNKVVGRFLNHKPFVFDARISQKALSGWASREAAWEWFRWPATKAGANHGGHTLFSPSLIFFLTKPTPVSIHRTGRPCSWTKGLCACRAGKNPTSARRGGSRTPPTTKSRQPAGGPQKKMLIYDVGSGNVYENKGNYDKMSEEKPGI